MDHREKLAWARKHFDALEKSVVDFVESKPYRIAVKFDRKTGEHIASFFDVTDPPADWSLMVGDIVHGMRSALDSLTYALAVKQSGESAANASNMLGFPIFDTPDGWRDRHKRRVGLLSTEARAKIQELQPYQGAAVGKTHVLSILRDLSNTDKHKRLLLTLVRGTDVEMVVTPIVGGDSRLPAKVVSDFRGPVRNDTVIARWNFAPDQPDQVDVDIEFTVDVKFGDRASFYRQPIRQTLIRVGKHIERQVFPPLEEILDR